MTTRVLWLVGMPGSGKTTLSQMLNQMLRVSHVDTDDLILKTTQTKDLASVVDSTTEESFYELEGRVVKELAEGLGEDCMIVATGGSVVHSPVAVEAMRSTPNSTVVWLQASVEDLLFRCGGVEGMRARGVVMEDGSGMDSLCQKRNPLYAAASHHRLDTSKLDISECCEYLSRLLK